MGPQFEACAALAGLFVSKGEGRDNKKKLREHIRLRADLLTG